MFDEILRRLWANGWVEGAPGETFWRFHKGSVTAFLRWNTGVIEFVSNRYARFGEE